MHRTRQILAAVVLLGMLVVLAACGSSGTSGGTSGSGSSGGTSAGGTTITEQNFAFNPGSSTVNVGDTVTFVNKDSADHHVVVGTTDLGVQASGASVTWKATTAGNFPLKCIIHPTMTGDITVK